MIKIKRAKCPKRLLESKASSKYGLRQVVDALWVMQNGKCCYCEQMIPNEGHGKAVEHFKPQSVFKDNKNDWKNLLLACPNCNGKKSDLFPYLLTTDSGETKIIYKKAAADTGEDLLIDPSDDSDNPEDHIEFIVDEEDEDCFGSLKAKNKSDKGKTTIEVTGIDLPYYIKERREFHDALNEGYRNLLKAKRGGYEEYLDQLKIKWGMYLSSKGRFAAFAREFAKFKEIDKKFQITIPS